MGPVSLTLPVFEMGLPYSYGYCEDADRPLSSQLMPGWGLATENAVPPVLSLPAGAHISPPWGGRAHRAAPGFPLAFLSLPVSLVLGEPGSPPQRLVLVLLRTLIHGDKKGGFTIFWADDGLDTGDLLLQKECEVLPDDTVSTLYNRFLFPEGVKGMVRPGNRPCPARLLCSQQASLAWACHP